MAISQRSTWTLVHFAMGLMFGLALFFILADSGWILKKQQTVNVVVQNSDNDSIDGSLYSYFMNNQGNEMHKWLHYFEVYEKHLHRFKNKPVTIVEIGVSHGGSLQMWKSFFGPEAKIIGVDIDENCLRLKEDQVDILIGDQADRQFLSKIKSMYPKVDIVIDDGGHTMVQQITSFEELFPHLAPDGVYIVEDAHTSYWDGYGGGLKKDGTFIEFTKRHIDLLNGWHYIQNPPDLTKEVQSIHYYDSMVVYERRPRTKPVAMFKGKRTIPDDRDE